jgi:glutathione-regulated potassium-efflux system protein KefB
LRTLGRDAATLGAPQIVLSAAAIGLYVWWVYSAWDIAAVLALGFALSSTIVVVQLLTDRGELHTGWGRKAFAILLAQDLAVVPLLLVVSLMAERGSGAAAPGASWLRAIVFAAGAVVGIVVVGRFVLTRLLAVAESQNNAPAFTSVTFLGVLGAALAAEEAGLSMALGTFLLGMTLSMSRFGHRIEAAVEPAKNTLLALFFLSIGLSIDLQVVGGAWAGLIFSTAVILALKLAVVLVIALISGVALTDALRLGLALAQCGEFGFVIFAAAQTGGLMSAELSALASVLITISMLATPFLVRLGDRLTAP